MVTNNRNNFVVTHDPYAQWLHDFNNVLAAIRLQAVLGKIHAGDASTDLLEILQAIEKSCERATELLKQIPDKSAMAVNGRDALPLVRETDGLNLSDHSGCILLMDDNESLRVSLFKILSNLGYTVEIAADGKECVARMRELYGKGKRVDICVLDLKIPGGFGGVETLVRLREIDPHIKAVASTGFSEGDIVTNFRRYGFQAALSKPFRVQELIDLLDKLTHASACMV